MGVKITDTTMRDGHQSLLATRMRTEDMLPIAAQMDEAGFHSVEVWGGATFDTALRFLHEDPWERLRALKKLFKKTPLQMLLRGQNVVGYRHYADDVVEKFCELAVKNGMDIFRIFDALNDLRNLETAIKAVKKAGGHAQGTVCYTISPVHTTAMFAAQAKELEEMGCDSICIKDMAGLLHPYDAFEIVKSIKAVVSIPVQMHCHCTSGMAEMAYLKAAEAGLDVMDCALSTLSQGTSQPPTESMVATFENTELDTKLDLEELTHLADYFGEVRKKYAAFEGNVKVDAGVLLHQVPGGMISNLVSQLREQNALDKLRNVLDEIPKVREDLGYPPLVTPTSQIVGTQAVFNALYGERYKQITKETRAVVLGQYGQTPAPISAAVLKKIAPGEKPISGRPADALQPELEKARTEAGAHIKSDEDLLSYVLFPQVAQEFFEWRERADGLEDELIAAIATALAQEQARGHEAAHAAPGGNGHDHNPWRLAGRARAMRGSR
ncbi:MAG TPA: pyruvate/oxaloacetate carboxyltransferase [Dehalococcoidia bacterium]|nr:pyruvate/oxaloacetate carboxyltransferase [Dehalococcoidia bacterium]